MIAMRHCTVMLPGSDSVVPALQPAVFLEFGLCRVEVDPTRGGFVILTCALVELPDGRVRQYPPEWIRFVVNR